MLVTWNLLLVALVATANATAIVLPPNSQSATQIGNEIDSIDVSISHLTDKIKLFNGPAIVSDMRQLSDILSTATGSIKTEDAVEDESAAFLIANIRDELQPDVKDMLDALIEAKSKARNAHVQHKILGWLQNLRNMMQNLGIALAPKVPLNRRSELQKAMAVISNDFDAAIKVYGGAAGVQPP